MQQHRNLTEEGHNPQPKSRYGPHETLVDGGSTRCLAAQDERHVTKARQEEKFVQTEFFEVERFVLCHLNKTWFKVTSFQDFYTSSISLLQIEPSNYYISSPLTLLTYVRCDE